MDFRLSQHKLNLFLFIHSIKSHSSVSAHKVFTHIGEGTAGTNGIIVAHPLLIVRVLASGQNILIPCVVRFLIQHPASTRNLDGVAAAEMGVHVRAVRVTLIGAALEVSVLVKYNLFRRDHRNKEESQPSYSGSNL